MNIKLDNCTRNTIKKQLKNARISGEMKYQNRLLALLMLDKLGSIPQTAEVMLQSVRILYVWIAILATEGIDGLKPKKPSGRKARLSPEQKQALKAAVIKGPEAAGFACGRWTAAMIQDLIYQRFGVEYAVKYIPELLKSLGLSHKKVETFSHRVDYEAQAAWKNEHFPELVRRAASEGAVILYEDESTFRMWSRNAHSWGEKGMQLKAEVHMGSVYQKVFGAVELFTGRFHYRRASSLKSVQFVEFLRKIRAFYKGQKVYLIVDNGTSHKGPEVKRFLERNPEIELVFLPAYSPNLNPIEKIWKQMKQEHLHNRLFEKKTDFEKALGRALRSFKQFYERNCSLLKSWQTRAKDILHSSCQMQAL